MRLRRVQIKNVFSIEKAELDLKDRGLVLVTGFSHDENDPNGSGKSSLAHKAITWGLWGDTAVGAKADKVRKKGSKGEARVAVLFDGVDGDTYEVIRTRNPATLTLEQSWRKHGVINKATDCTQKLAAETQKLINDVLGRDFKTWLQTDFFGQGRTYSFAELPPGGQKQILADILPIETLDTWAKRATIHRKEVNMELSVLMTEKRTSDALVIQMAESIKGLEKQHANIQGQLDGIWGQIKIMVAPSVQYAQEKFKEASRLRESWVAHNHKLEAHQSALDSEGVCKACGSILDQYAEEEAQRTLDKVRSQLSSGKEAEQQAVLAVTHWQTMLTDAEKHDALEKEFGRIKALDVEEDLKKANRQITHQHEAIAAAIHRIGVLTKEKEHLVFWEHTFGKSLKSFLFDKICGILNDTANGYIQSLGNPQIKINFSTDKRKADGEVKEEFNVAVESDTGGGEYGLLSGGEQQLANFAIGLALAQLAETQAGGGSRFMVLDEPFTNLGPTNCERLVNFISGYLATRKDTILLISNEAQLAELISSRIHVEKRNGTTEIVNV